MSRRIGSKFFTQPGHWVLLACFMPLLSTLGGCTTLTFYAQAVAGHLEVLAARRPVTE